MCRTATASVSFWLECRELDTRSVRVAYTRYVVLSRVYVRTYLWSRSAERALARLPNVYPHVMFHPRPSPEEVRQYHVIAV